MGHIDTADNTRTLVLGLGKSGAFVARYCAERGDDVTLYGGLKSEPGELGRGLEQAGVRVVYGTEDVQGSYDLCVTSPGISEFSDFFRAAQACSAEIVSEPEFAWRESPERWVAITGTNGKTTTTTFTRDLLRGAGMRATAVGNIGYLCTEAVTKREDGEWFVAELSSFQLAVSRRLHPHVAVLLNVTPDHIAWHKTLENYAAAKEKIFANLTPDDLAVVAVGDDWCRAIADRLDARGLRLCRLSLEGDPGTPCAAFVRDGRLVVRLDGTEHELCGGDDLQIKGVHNVENALAAATVALAVGAPEADVAAGLVAFAPLEHRIEPCGELAGVRFVDDSKATNTDAVEKALTAFEPGSVVLLLGGHDKGTDLASLAEAAARDCAAAVCYGDAGPRIAAALREHLGDSSERVYEAPHMAEALDRAIDIALPGQTVLLSPACSSFDEFSGFEERGRVFKDLVAERIREGR